MLVWPTDEVMSKEWGSSSSSRIGENAFDAAVRLVMEEVDEYFGKVAIDGLFITSFCREGDLLSQWRGYGGRGGYSLEFSPNRLGKFSFGTKKQYEASIHRVLYNRDKQDELIGILFGLVSRVTRFTESSDGTLDSQEVRDQLKIIGHKVVMGLNATSTRLKHPAFEQEHEIRVSTQLRLDGETKDANDVCFRVSDGINIPTVKLPIGPDTLELVGVCCGPTLPKVKAKRSVELMLKRYGYPATVEVKESAMPLAW